MAVFNAIMAINLLSSNALCFSYAGQKSQLGSSAQIIFKALVYSRCIHMMVMHKSDSILMIQALEMAFH